MEQVCSDSLVTLVDSSLIKHDQLHWNAGKTNSNKVASTKFSSIIMVPILLNTNEQLQFPDWHKTTERFCQLTTEL